MTGSARIAPTLRTLRIDKLSYKCNGDDFLRKRTCVRAHYESEHWKRSQSLVTTAVKCGYEEWLSDDPTGFARDNHSKKRIGWVRKLLAGWYKTARSSAQGFANAMCFDFASIWASSRCRWVQSSLPALLFRPSMPLFWSDDLSPFLDDCLADYRRRH